MRIQTAQDLRMFYDALIAGGFHQAEGKIPSLLFITGPDALMQYRESHGPTVYELFSTIPNLDFEKSHCGDRILSIGTAKIHDRARVLSATTHVPYVTCPVPLTNDAFATDRIHGTSTEAAAIATFPCAVILDWNLIASTSLQSNILGFGEAIGLIASVRDFCSTTNTCKTRGLVVLADDLIEELVLDLSRESKIFSMPILAKLAACLSVKGLLIWLMETNTVIAACDHLVVYDLSVRGFTWPHGTLVFAGALLTLPIFHDITMERMFSLLAIAHQNGLFTNEHIRSLLEINLADVLRTAPDRRPGRATVLRNLGQLERDTIAKHVRGILLDYERAL